MATINNNLSDYNLEEIPNSEGLRFAVIVSEWNNHITDSLFKGAEEALLNCGVKENDIVRIDVPGSFELIYGAKLASKYNYDAIICIGSVIKGETDHFDFANLNLFLSEENIFQYFFYLFKCAIFIAVIADSTPLFPCFPPDLSIACCSILSVKTPNITGMFNCKFRSFIPNDTALQTKSK